MMCMTKKLSRNYVRISVDYFIIIPTPMFETVSTARRNVAKDVNLHRKLTVKHRQSYIVYDSISQGICHRLGHPDSVLLE